MNMPSRKLSMEICVVAQVTDRSLTLPRVSTHATTVAKQVRMEDLVVAWKRMAAVDAAKAHL